MCELEDILAKVPAISLPFSGRARKLREYDSAAASAGYLQVQDIFVTDLKEYRVGFTVREA